jgi:hypothetical protein
MPEAGFGENSQSFGFVVRFFGFGNDPSMTNVNLSSRPNPFYPFNP